MSTSRHDGSPAWQTGIIGLSAMCAMCITSTVLVMGLGFLVRMDGIAALIAGPILLALPVVAVSGVAFYTVRGIRLRRREAEHAARG